MNEDDKLAVLLDEPEIRVMVFALAHSGPAAGPVRLLGLVASVLTEATEAQRDSWLDAGGKNAPVSPEHVGAIRVRRPGSSRSCCRTWWTR